MSISPKITNIKLYLFYGDAIPIVSHNYFVLLMTDFLCAWWLTAILVIIWLYFLLYIMWFLYRVRVHSLSLAIIPSVRMGKLSCITSCNWLLLCQLEIFIDLFVQWQIQYKFLQKMVALLVSFFVVFYNGELVLVSPKLSVNVGLSYTL